MVLGGGALGITVCTESNQPLVMLDWSLRDDTAAIAEVMEHELEHVRDAISYPGGCKEFRERYRVDQEFRIEAELKGYCRNAARAVRKKVAQPDLVAAFFTAFLLHIYPTDQTEAQIRKQFDACIKAGGVLQNTT